VTLVAVSKTWPAAVVREAVDAGQRVFGENKVQELLGKAPELPDDLEWHLIGHLQKNKARKVVSVAAATVRLDSVDLAQRLDRIAGEEGLEPRVFVQVNVSGDDAKFGFAPDELAPALEEMLPLEHLRIEGLMTVPAYDPDPERVRPHFARLRELRDELAERLGRPLPGLSMGMSHDFPVAIEEGATLVRVGSSIFGQRDYSQ